LKKINKKIKLIKDNSFKIVLWTGAFLAFIFLPSKGLAVLSNGENTENKSTVENQVDQAKADEAEDKIDNWQDKIKDVKKDKEKEVKKKLQISSEIGAINQNIAVVQNELKKTDKEIEEIKKELKAKNDLIDKQKESLRQIIRRMNQLNLESGLILMEKKQNWGEFFMLNDNLEQMEEKLFQVIERIKKDKEEREAEVKKYEEVYQIKEDQKGFLQSEKNKKSYVLNKTQNKINIHEATIAKLQAKIAKLQAEFASLLGKGYDTEDIKQAVKFAAGATGIRKNFLMGMLVVESGLGRYTGSCNYKESKMNKHRKEVFRKICKKLGYNYKKKKLSCPPKNYKGTGGAMGVAQFMPDTWSAYENQIASRTGHHPPDPWNLVDGVTAMASKLARDGATSKKGECQAAKRYLGGSHQWYCDKVLYWAENYEQLL